MLRLLHKIRVQPSEDSKRFWLFTISEFLLVVLGILIALQIENWNQNRQERQLESVLLNELLLNLRADYDDIQINLSLLSIALNSSEIVLNQLEEKNPYHDSLNYHFGQLTAGAVFFKNLSAFESIKSIGIDIISNDSLRQQISHLYSVMYDVLIYGEKLHHQVVLERLFPVCSETLRTINPPIDSAGYAIPIDYPELYDNNVFKEAVKQSIFHLILQIRNYQKTRDLLLSLVADIEKELA